jgi:hypothetical protein
LENWKSKICSIFERTFLLKNLPVTHVRQATIFAGQTVKTGTYFEACIGLFLRTCLGGGHLQKGTQYYTEC